MIGVLGYAAGCVAKDKIAMTKAEVEELTGLGVDVLTKVGDACASCAGVGRADQGWRFCYCGTHVQLPMYNFDEDNRESPIGFELFSIAVRYNRLLLFMYQGVRAKSGATHRLKGLR